MNPPTFEEAKNKRQKVRAAGLDPNHWYAVEQSHALAKGRAIDVKFWGTSAIGLPSGSRTRFGRPPLGRLRVFGAPALFTFDADSNQQKHNYAAELEVCLR